MLKKAEQGFTLAELLISLALLGVLATFVIPKIIGASTNGQNKAIAKEAGSMIAGAFATFKQNSTLSSSTTPAALTSYMNFVSIDTSTDPVNVPAGETAMGACAAATPCLTLHNGALLQYQATDNFAGTTSTHFITFNVDPDGGDSAAGAASFVLFYNGRLTTYETGDAASGTTSASPLTPIATDPVWIDNWN